MTKLFGLNEVIFFRGVSSDEKYKFLSFVV